MGSTWESFIYNEFFKCLDFELLELKRIEPIFVPSSEKTNFDATYDLEELLLEEAPLEARARRQKPRERLKDDATEKEIREDELYRMIESDFKPFDYTVAAYKRITEGAGSTEEGPQATDNAPQAITTDEATPVPAVNGGYHSSPLNPSTSNESRTGRPVRPAPPPPLQNNFQTRHVPSIAGQRMTSPTGGVQVTLDGSGSWSELARQDATLPTDANNIGDGKSEGSGGMFGFLKSKKGRTNSPKPKERGVLGKEGARVVIG
jgi:serine/threonine kinase 32